MHGKCHSGGVITYSNQIIDKMTIDSFKAVSHYQPLNGGQRLNECTHAVQSSIFIIITICVIFGTQLCVLGAAKVPEGISGRETPHDATVKIQACAY